MPRLALLGGGGFAKEVAEIAEMNGFDVTACYALDPGHFEAIHRGYLDDLIRDKGAYDAVALGVGGVDRRSLAVRRGLIEWLRKSGLDCPPMTSPRAVCSKGVKIGAGAFVAHGAVLAVDAILQDFCVINSGAIIGHDAMVGCNVTIAPGAFIGGGAQIGEDTLVGPLAKVLQGVKLGRGVILGIGCTALRSLPDGATVWPRSDRTT
jgi:sugar O-acyltransferase (sialic acid O-acetyltransferase NeuD family)